MSSPRKTPDPNGQRSLSPSKNQTPAAATPRTSTRRLPEGMSDEEYEEYLRDLDAKEAEKENLNSNTDP
jgi:hypothetical protein